MNKYEKEKTWKPLTNDKIEGILTDKLTNVGKYKANLYKIVVDDITYDVWGRHQLDELMQKTSIGDRIIIRFNGIIKTKNYNMYDYDVEIL